MLAPPLVRALGLLVRAHPSDVAHGFPARACGLERELQAEFPRNLTGNLIFQRDLPRGFPPSADLLQEQLRPLVRQNLGSKAYRKAVLPQNMRVATVEEPVDRTALRPFSYGPAGGHASICACKVFTTEQTAGSIHPIGKRLSTSGRAFSRIHCLPVPGLPRLSSSKLFSSAAWSRAYLSS